MAAFLELKTTLAVVPWIETLYEWSLRLAKAGLGATARGDGKIARGVQGRREVVAVLETWARAERDPGRPLVWLHAPSVGEALMAGAIGGAFRRMQPRSQIAFTFFSPSAERVASKVGADVVAYAPWDVRTDVQRSLEALRPDVVAFIRTEVWPTLAREAKRAGARVALLNAPLAEGSSRLRPFARQMLGGVYAALDAVGVVNECDMERFTRLRVSADRVRITGDARFDQVHDRVHRLDRAQPLLDALSDGSRNVVAGSTWRADESVLLDAWVRAALPGTRLIIAPHEPTESHISGLEAAIDRHKLQHARIDHVIAGADTPILIVDRVGILADLYSVAHIAYVGGGFGTAGLHSVIEPAALGVPVLFGPNHGNAVEGRELAEAGGGFIVHSAQELAERLRMLAREQSAGAAAKAWVESRLGGAARNAEVLDELLSAAAADR